MTEIERRILINQMNIMDTLVEVCKDLRTDNYRIQLELERASQETKELLESE